MLKRLTILVVIACAASSLDAQTPECQKVAGAMLDHSKMDHAAHQASMNDCPAPVGSLPSLPGQAAFGSIAEVVHLLDADPNTDWTKVNVDALRQHLIDMDEVTMHASVKQRNIPGGVELQVTGVGRTAEAIKRMAVNHTRTLEEGGDMRASARVITNGATILATARDTNDARAVARLRGLGFAGIMTLGNHHAPHHLALARGDAVHTH